MSTTATRRSRATTLVGPGLRFVRAFRDFSRNPVTFDEAVRAVSAAHLRRDRAFLDRLDELVWPFPQSPAARLMACAGIERGDVREMVEGHGLEGALERLRDAGVYVSYEESLGKVPVQRGSASFDVHPKDFRNPIVNADYMVVTGGTRSEGTEAQSNFHYIRRQATTWVLHTATWDVNRVPTAAWVPVFPSAGITAILKLTGAGNQPERWFTQIEPNLKGVTYHKRLANRMLQMIGPLRAVGMPPPEFVPASTPGPVVAWVQEALGRSRRVCLPTMASCGAALGVSAREAEISLAGLVIFIGGEPVTRAKLEALRSAGADAVNSYAFTPEGQVAVSCPWCGPEELHLWDHDHAVVGRRRSRADGVEVTSFCWTSLAPDAPRVLVNVENDDYGTISVDTEPCFCLVGQLGMRIRLAGIRGSSKVVTGGTTIPGELLEKLAEEMLPKQLGGGPGDYQFAEAEEDSGVTALTLRVDPRLGAIDEAAAVRLVNEALGCSDNGLLARRLWGDRVRVQRTVPVRTPVAKLLPFEPLSTRQVPPIGPGA